MRRVLGWFFLILAVVAVSVLAHAQQTLTVPDDYPTIQAAIDVANPGDTVYVKAGRYVENLTITKPLHLIGEDRTKVIIQSPDKKKDVITVHFSSGEVSITSIKACMGRTGIFLSLPGGTKASVTDAISYDNVVGIDVVGEGELSLSGSFLIDNRAAGLSLRNGVATVDGNEILLGGIGIVLDCAIDAAVTGNLVGLCNRGIDTYSAACGYPKTEDVFTRTVRGKANRIYGLERDLCPEASSSIWPEGFRDTDWEETIEQVVSLYNLGIKAYKSRDYAAAFAEYTEGLSLLNQVSFPLLAASCNQNIGTVYDDLAQYEDALKSYQLAKTVYASRGMEVNIAKIDQNIGNVYAELGRYENALTTYKTARAVYVSHGMEIDVADINTNIGIVYGNLGRYESALINFQSARVVFVAHNMDVDVAKIDKNIGNVYTCLGRYEDALTVYQSARVVFAAHNMDVDVAGVDHNSGIVYDYLGQYEHALAKYRSARAVYTARGMDANVAKINGDIGAVYDDLGRYADALNAYQSARVVFVAHNMDVAVAKIDANIGNIYRRLRRYTGALASYQNALNILNKTPPAAGMPYSYPATRWMIYENMGLANEGLKHWDAARQSYEKSIAVIESLRGYMRSEKLKTAWQERTQDVYEHLIKLLIEHGHGAAAFPYAERCRARTFLDTLYQGGISPRQVIKEGGKVVGVKEGAVDPTLIDAAIKESQGELKANEAVLEYFVTQDGIYLWVITEDGISTPIFIKYSRDQLMRDVITLRETLESNNPNQSTLTEFLTSFYTKLVKPGLDKLTGRKIDTLVFIPSGPLWYLPFAAVEMSDHQESNGLGTRYPYLVERYTIAYLPSLASLSSLTKKGTQPVPKKPMIALADPAISATQLQTSSKCAVKPLPRYPGLVKAARAFADELVGSDTGKQYVYAGSKAQEGVAYTVAGEKVEVYAAHGQFNPSVPLESKLLLAPGGEATRVQSDLRNPDGNYHAWEALLTDHRGTELVVLAACESLLPHLGEMTGTLATLGNKDCDQVKLSPEQLKQIVVGDEVVGLARAFLSSGAKSVLGTLWLANSTAVGKVLVAMGEYRKGGDSWAQALAKAQRDLIKDNTYSNPWLWAPYQLIGRWR